MSGKCFDSLVTLATLMSPVDNYSQYKQHQGQRTGPYVPFLGIMLSDLSFIDDFNVSKSPAGLNFAKAAQMSEIIEPFATCQVSLSLSLSLSNLRWLRLLPIHSSCGLRAVLQREEYSLPVSESLREFVLLSVTSTTPITKESSVAPTLELSDTSTRAHELKKLVDECFSPPEMLWNRQLTVNDYELRSRDWKVLFTGANLFSYAPNEIIFEHVRIRPKKHTSLAHQPAFALIRCSRREIRSCSIRSSQDRCTSSATASSSRASLLARCSASTSSLRVHSDQTFQQYVCALSLCTRHETVH